MPVPFSIQIYDADRLLALKDVWDQCAVNNNSYFPFLCFDWFVTWLQHFPETLLHVAVLYEHRDVAAIMPVMRKTAKKKGVFLTSYAFAGNDYSQAGAILHNTTNPDARVAQAELLLRYFMQHAPAWDYFDLYGLQPENGNCDQMIRAISRCGLRYFKSIAYGNCYQDNIYLSADEYIRTRPNKVRKNSPYYRRKMEREGELQFRLVAETENLETVMDSYYQLYAKSWKQSEDLGPNYHRDLAKFVAGKGWLRLGFLDFNAIPIACQFWLVEGAKAFILKSFYDKGFQHYSPGTVLSELMIRALIEQDSVTGIDYLQGEEAYKRDWVDNRRERIRLLVYNGTVLGKILLGFTILRNILSRAPRSATTILPIIK
jgi:hypothetical protein